MSSSAFQRQFESFLLARMHEWRGGSQRIKKYCVTALLATAYNALKFNHPREVAVFSLFIKNLVLFDRNANTVNQMNVYSKSSDLKMTRYVTLYIESTMLVFMFLWSAEIKIGLIFVSYPVGPYFDFLGDFIGGLHLVFYEQLICSVFYICYRFVNTIVSFSRSNRWKTFDVLFYVWFGWWTLCTYTTQPFLGWTLLVCM